jgi:hypothetical protein
MPKFGTLSVLGNGLASACPSPWRQADHGGTYNSTSHDEYASHFSGRRSTPTRGQSFSLCGQVTLTVVAINGNGVSSSDEDTSAPADGGVS